MCVTLMYFSDFRNVFISINVSRRRSTVSVSCLTADTCLTADQGITSSIPAPPYNFMEIGHEIISMSILLENMIILSLNTVIH